MRVSSRWRPLRKGVAERRCLYFSRKTSLRTFVCLMVPHQFVPSTNCIFAALVFLYLFYGYEKKPSITGCFVPASVCFVPTLDDLWWFKLPEDSFENGWFLTISWKWQFFFLKRIIYCRFGAFACVTFMQWKKRTLWLWCLIMLKMKLRTGWCCDGAAARRTLYTYRHTVHVQIPKGTKMVNQRVFFRYKMKTAEYKMYNVRPWFEFIQSF